MPNTFLDKQLCKRSCNIFLCNVHEDELLSCSFDNAEVYEAGKAEEVMGQAFKVLARTNLYQH